MTYEVFVADLSKHLGLPHVIKPQVVVCDNGPYYVSHNFREFLSGEQVALRPATPYVPQQNSFVERMWGVTFGTARVLLAAAGLPPAFWPYAFQTSRWLHNRLPQPSRGNLSPYFILTRRAADIGHLRAFGCPCSVHVPEARRSGDRHLADRALAGVYLGPSEEHPAAVVMLLSSRKVLASRDIVCYEDRFPGVSNSRYDWFTDDEGVVAGNDAAGNDAATTFSPPTPSRILQPATAESAPSDAEPPRTPLSVQSPLPSPPRASTGSQPSHSAPLSARQPRQEGVGSRSQPDTVLFPSIESDITRHPQADDPRSIHFDRVSRQPQLRRARAPVVRYGAWNGQPPQARPAIAPFLALLAASEAPHSICLYSQEAVSDATDFAGGTHALAQSADVRSTVELGDVVIPKGYRKAMESPHRDYWLRAIATEMAGLIKMRTWDIVLLESVPKGCNIMNCHFVFDLKRNSRREIEKFKARLVADGNSQRYGVDFDRVFSTVVRLSTVRLIMVIAAAYDYNLWCVDIRQAFLQADVTHSNLYMHVPPGHPTHDAKGRRLALRLNKSLYGLKQAGREWNKLLVSRLVEYGFTASAIDVCLFIRHRDGKLLMLLVWVDDIIIVDNHPPTRSSFIEWLTQQFSLEDRGELEWVLGMQVSRDRARRTISLSQEQYVADLLQKYSHLIEHSRTYTAPMDDKSPLTSDMSPVPDSPEWHAMASKRAEYMGLVGSYLWLANVTYYHLTFASSQLSRFISNPGEPHFAAAVRVLIFIRDNPWVLRYEPSITPSSPLEIYVDSNWGTKFSVSGALFFFGRALIAWFSKVQRSVSFSSAEAELFGAILAAREGIYYRELLSDLGFLPSTPTRILSDSKSCIDLSYDPVSFKKTKHILRASEGLRDYVARLIFVMAHVEGKYNIADILTKAQAPSVYAELMALYTRLYTPSA